MKKIEVEGFLYDRRNDKKSVLVDINSKKSLDKIREIQQGDDCLLVTGDKNLYIKEVEEYKALKYTETYMQLVLYFNFDKGGCWAEDEEELTKEM
ncbi:MAG: hypothetical protein ACOC1X_02855, partial [Promethearchaeota archaeon]